MHAGGVNFTGFNAVNIKGSVMLRYGGNDTYRGTLSINGGSIDDADLSWRMPQKSGVFPIMGTFAVQLPSIASVHYSTAVTVAGIRAEDAVVVQFNGTNIAGTTYGFEQSTAYILKQVKPTNGGLNLYFHNLGNATAYVDMTMSYIAMR